MKPTYLRPSDGKPYEYSFLSKWSVPVPPARAFATLRALEHYPRWWQEVRTSTRVAAPAQTFDFGIRATLPYTLHFRTEQTKVDEKKGVLESKMTGDLEGFSRWTVTSDGEGGSILVFEEGVDATKALLKYTRHIFGWMFRYNHTLMMEHGESGLREYFRTGGDGLADVTNKPASVRQAG